MDDLFDDTPAHKLARTTDPQTSKDAATAAPTGKMRKFVLDLIILAGKGYKDLLILEYVDQSLLFGQIVFSFL